MLTVFQFMDSASHNIFNIFIFLNSLYIEFVFFF